MCYSPSRAWACPDCWMKDLPCSLEVRCDQHIESPADVAVLDCSYRYKSVASQIPHDDWLEPTLYRTITNRTSTTPVVRN